MPRKPKTLDVNPKLAQELLNATGVIDEDDLLGDALIQTTSRLKRLVKVANARVNASTVARMTAEALATRAGIKGPCHIIIHEDGTVLLEMKKKSNLPKIKELRERAIEMGVSSDKIAAFGAQRKNLFEYLENLATEEVSADPVKDLPKPEPAEAPEEAVSGPDEVTVLPSIASTAKGFRKTGLALSKPQEVDIDSLLAEAKTFD